MWRALHVLQQDDNNMHQAFERIQIGVPPAPQNPKGIVNQQVLQLVPESIKELKINLPEKFDGIRPKF